MQSVEEIAKEIVAREGGYVNDPADPGGATKYGVTLATMQGLGLDLTGDGRVTASDVRALSRDRAVSIFVEHYYRRPGIDRLPEALRPGVFDMYVNAGITAVKILQRLLCEMGESLTADGLLGPRTAAAAARCAAEDPQALADAYAIARRNYYYALGDARPALRKFARRRDGGKGGWILRAESFLSPAYHLSEAGHRARVAAWA